MNKRDILRMSGIDSEEEFYRRYPTEELFMLAYGGIIPKTDVGTIMTNPQKPSNFPSFDVSLASYMKQRNYNPYTQYYRSNTDKLNEYLIPAEEKPMDIESWMTNEKTFASRSGKNKINPALGVPVAENIVKGIQQLIDEGKQKKETERDVYLTDVMAKAAQTRDIDADRMNQEALAEFRFDNPKNIYNIENFYPANGVGTNILAKKGKRIPKAESGFMTQLGEFNKYGGGDILNNLSLALSGGDSGGATLGGAAGDVVSMIPGVGPIVSTVAKPVLTAIGNLFDTNPEKIRKNQRAIDKNVWNIALGHGAAGLAGQYSGYMDKGGNVSKTAFDGDLQVYGEGGIKPLSSRTMLLTGPSHEDEGIKFAYGNNVVEGEGNEPIVEMDEGGMLGNPETEAVVFGEYKIPGTNIKFKKAVKDMGKEETKLEKNINKSLLLASNTDPNYIHDRTTLNSAMMNIEGANQKLDWFKENKRHLADVQQAMKEVADESGYEPDKLLEGKLVRIKDINAKYGTIIPKAQKGFWGKVFWPQLQNKNYNPSPTEPATVMENLRNSAFFGSPNVTVPYRPGYKVPIQSYDAEVNTTPEEDTREQYIPSVGYTKFGDPGFGSFDQMMGQKMGGKFEVPKQTRTHSTLPLYGGITPQMIARDWDPQILKSAGLDYKKPETWKQEDIRKLQDTIKIKYPHLYSNLKDKSSSTSGLFGLDWYSLGVPLKGITPKGTAPLPTKDFSKDLTIKSIPSTGKSVPEKGKGKIPWEYLNLIPMFRPSNAEPLDTRQLLGELSALSDDVEPVQARLYHPQLDVPYDISLQDQLNEVTAQTRAAQKMTGYNPAAQMMLSGQSYDPRNRVLAEQFRLNQAKKDQVYSQNRNILNDAQLKNLGILDTQYTRQSQAKSNTKAVKQAALNSISAKYAQKQLENRELAAYENLYNYRFDKRGRVWNWNPLARFNPTGDGYGGMGGGRGLAEGKQFLYDSSGNIVSIGNVPKDRRITPKSTESGRNGAIVRAINSL